MDVFILDTNLFFNMEAGFALGGKTEEVTVNLTKIANSLKKEKKAEFLLPPKAVDEYLSFFQDKNQPFIREFLSAVTVKSPDVSQVDFPASVFYQLIDDIRARSYRGLNISEEEIEAAVKELSGENSLSKKDFQIAIGKYIKSFRERYRQATRFGFLDSVTDLDLIVLAKEVDGFLVSADEGVIKWGRVFGIKEMPAAVFQKRLEALLGK